MIGLMINALRRPLLVVFAVGAIGATGVPAFAAEEHVHVPPGTISVIYQTTVLFANMNSITSTVSMCPAGEYLDITTPDSGPGYEVATAGTFFDTMGNEIGSFTLPLPGDTVADNGGDGGGGGQDVFGG